MSHISEESLDAFLAHYGVKGMKWGVRRTPEQLGHRPRLTRAERKEARYQKRYEAESRRLQKQISEYKAKKIPDTKAGILKERAQIQAKIDKMDMNKAYIYENVKGFRSPKVYQQSKARGDKTPYQKLSAVEKEKLDSLGKGRKAQRNAYIAKSLAIGVAETALVVGGARYVIPKMGLSKDTTRAGMQGAVVILGGTLAKLRVEELNGVMQASKFKDHRARRAELDRALREIERA